MTTESTPEERRKRSQRVFFRPTERFCKTLGERISIARRKRSLTQQDIADRCLMSLSTYRRIEKGDSSVTVAALLRVLFLLGGVHSLDELMDPLKDELGNMRQEENLPKRVRNKPDDFMAL